MNNAIKVQSISNGHISYAERIINVDIQDSAIAICCRRDISNLVILTRRDMNRILIYTTDFKSKIIPCHLS